jgi:hypothetical protein
LILKEEKDEKHRSFDFRDRARGGCSDRVRAGTNPCANSGTPNRRAEAD